MSNNLRDDAPVVYFVSDVHLGGSQGTAETEKQTRFQGLLQRVRSEKASLYVLGDLFDFWFTYRRVIPRAGFGILARLEAMAGDGADIRYLGGNHDFWIEGFLREDTRIEVIPDHTRILAQGKVIELAHGDGLGPGDTGYKILKRVLRNRAAISLFRWVHPDLGIPLGLRSSHVSRESTADHPVDTEALYRHVGLPALADGADAFLMGHHHVAVHISRDSGDFMILGDWFRQYTCARLREGKLEMLRWPLTD
jgi:UDP-2,3-diacylglucosamine hydrolase